MKREQARAGERRLALHSANAGGAFLRLKSPEVLDLPCVFSDPERKIENVTFNVFVYAGPIIWMEEYWRGIAINIKVNNKNCIFFSCDLKSLASPTI